MASTALVRSSRPPRAMLRPWALAIVGLLTTGCRIELERAPCTIDVDCPDGEMCYEDLECIKPDVARQLGAMVGTECAVEGGAIRGCEHTCRMGFCDGPPRFDGASVAVSDGSSALIVRWATPSDQTPEEDLVYSVFMSTEPGGQDYATPTLTVVGENEARVAGLVAQIPYYFVVRATDEYDQTDDNTHEVRGVPGCIEHATQVQPLFDRRCVSCHGEEAPERGLRLDSLDALRAGTSERTQIVPCRSEDSWLVHRAGEPPALDDRGPHGGLEAEELATLRQWIDEGARDACPVDPAICADVVAPTFAGLAMATTPSPSTAELCWAAADDDASPEAEIVYRVYEAREPGAQRFDDFPAATRTGDTCATLTGRVPGETYCWVVRARDGAGNEDANTAERCLTVPGAACIDYDEVVQPLFDRRCIHCHGGPEPVARLSLTGRDGVLDGGRSGLAVTACEPEGRLVDKLGPAPAMGARMPGDGPPFLSDAEITAVRRWVAEGARSSCEEPGPC